MRNLCAQRPQSPARDWRKGPFTGRRPVCRLAWQAMTHPPPERATSAEDMRQACEVAREVATQAHATLPPEQLPMWVVFGPGTTDHPGVYVARLWATLPANESTGYLLRAGDLETLRACLPPGLACLTRNPEDDPNILETWF
jgi:hypothetical protein